MRQIRTHGTASAVSVNFGGQAKLLHDREVAIDLENGVVYVSDESGAVHELTVPLRSTLIHWMPEGTGEADQNAHGTATLRAAPRAGREAPTESLPWTAE